LGMLICVKKYWSPVGPLGIGCTQRGLSRISFDYHGDDVGRSDLVDDTISQLNEYFSGSRRQFSLPLDLRGTAFQQEVWNVLLQIPFGQVATYGEVAKRAGFPRAYRAVGAACAKNPVAIVVPCHRVVGVAGLTGFGGGLDVKEYLLQMEGVIPQRA